MLACFKLTGRSKFFILQAKLAGFCVAILLAGGFLIFKPTISYVGTVLIIAIWALGLQAIFKRNEYNQNL